MRVGVIGGGQLAWMMAPEATKLGISLLVQTPSTEDPAAAVTETVLAPLRDAKATAELAARCDAITFENEFVDLDALGELEKQGVIFAPSLSVLAPLLDKYHQRCYLRDIGLPVPEFISWFGDEQSSFLGKWPLVVKARRHGYDGRGTEVVHNMTELMAVWQRWGRVPVLLEEFIPFERELAVMAARSRGGEIAIYPVVETQQENQVCRRVLVPAAIDPKVAAECETIARQLLQPQSGPAVVGIFGIELFLTDRGQLLVNEIAPRTHNSGHFTIDACEISQFQMQLRAVCDLPLGQTTLKSPGAVMVNLLGYEHSRSDYRTKRQQIAAIPGAHLHWYGKAESHPGRKLGHVTVLLESPEFAMDIARKVEYIWYPASES
ncbi:5-(carboxyamino)imidazole ribonucleotide synthase [[Phormidium] sp. ETS-05]|uniref:5-(carboxyamino)imidazole ribonucleotide synthase n=1 Tax=[Phormidium] sp. ETS-05 TaxID=222819 RepID=UPI0018EF15C1|nr:5-(carboxyamino)imidazole ribonucleotide synthase [[Phormidium] sp. ETS-05]